MTTDYPRLPLVFAYLVDFVRRSFGVEPSPTVNLCQAFHTIFWGLFPVPSALVARLLRFAFGHGRNEAILRALNSKRAKSILKVLCIFLFAGYAAAGVYVMVLYILEHGWWAFFIVILKIFGGAVVALILIVGVLMGATLFAKYLYGRRGRKARRADVPVESVSLRREVSVVWHFIVAVKRRLCPIYSNPLYRGSAKD